MFEPGDRVVCVKGSHPTLSEGTVYTVEIMSPRWSDMVVVLEAKVGPGLIGNGWLVSRFRKLDRADLLTKLLAEPQPQDERDGKRVVKPEETA